MVIQTQTPPPMYASTSSNPLNNHTSYENITTVDYVKNRFAWQSLVPDPTLLNSTRWSALSVVGDGSYYKSREVYSGPLATTVEALYATGLSGGFVA